MDVIKYILIFIILISCKQENKSSEEIKYFKNSFFDKGIEQVDTFNIKYRVRNDSLFFSREINFEKCHVFIAKLNREINYTNVPLNIRWNICNKDVIYGRIQYSTFVSVKFNEKLVIVEYQIRRFRAQIYSSHGTGLNTKLKPYPVIRKLFFRFNTDYDMIDYYQETIDSSYKDIINFHW